MGYFRADHELHDRRKGRNLGVAAVLIGLIVIVFGLTYVKITSGGSLEGFDHTVRPALITEDTQ
ncbi:hypothetical protein [Nereida sp. MMG025]|uniref:hypothetical protein n=1 Tax=Nereida sp. MMG025 TaxID=2909981 RepID=UPI001F3AC41B|nr:hypothetical protein [Nereida sp. MMG025]MCF6445036.1 hypothetical protein [Nereida sp. MMG025]